MHQIDLYSIKTDTHLMAYGVAQSSGCLLDLTASVGKVVEFSWSVRRGVEPIRPVDRDVVFDYSVVSPPLHICNSQVGVSEVRVSIPGTSDVVKDLKDFGAVEVIFVEQHVGKAPVVKTPLPSLLQLCKFLLTVPDICMLRDKLDTLSRCK